MMVVDRRLHQLEQVRAYLSVALYPVQYLVDMPSAMGGRILEALATRSALETENERLHTEQLLMRAQLQKFAALQSENIRLRSLLMSSQAVGERVLVAELLSVDLDPFSRQILINKGGRDGVYEGQCLLDANGVVGQITHVGPFTSTALMITDSSHALPVQVNRTGLRTVAMGSGSDGLELLHIPNTADLAQGDLLVTSGLGGRFPPGYPVARVSSFKPDTSRPFAKVYALPVAKIDRLREVLLVWVDEPPKVKIPVPVTPMQPPLPGAKSVPEVKP